MDGMLPSEQRMCTHYVQASLNLMGRLIQYLYLIQNMIISSIQVIAVGATEDDDRRAYFSNYGWCIDLFAPGLNIPSVGIGGREVTSVKSGTSMSCPHVTGEYCCV